MKKIITLLIPALLISSPVFACGGKEPNIHGTSIWIFAFLWILFVTITKKEKISFLRHIIFKIASILPSFLLAISLQNSIYRIISIIYKGIYETPIVSTAIFCLLYILFDKLAYSTFITELNISRSLSDKLRIFCLILSFLILVILPMTFLC